jgi:mRNA interferase HigB
MRVIAKKVLINFWKKHRDAEQPLKAWYDEVVNADWRTPNDIKLLYKSVSFIEKNRVIFNIAGNKYRLIVAVAYQFGAVYIKFLGIHKEYDRIDAANIELGKV